MGIGWVCLGEVFFFGGWFVFLGEGNKCWGAVGVLVLGLFADRSRNY